MKKKIPEWLKENRHDIADVAVCVIRSPLKERKFTIAELEKIANRTWHRHYDRNKDAFITIWQPFFDFLKDKKRAEEILNEK